MSIPRFALREKVTLAVEWSRALDVRLSVQRPRPLDHIHYIYVKGINFASFYYFLLNF